MKLNRAKRSSRICPDLASGWLEARIALSAGPVLSVVSITPSAGSSINAPPQSLVLTFDRPVDPGSVLFTDVLLDRVNDDGSLTPVFDPDFGAFEQLDDSGLVMTVPIDQTLEPGNYEVLLSAQATITGMDGSVTQSVIDGLDEPLANFTVTPPGVTLDQATDLGALAAGVQISSGGFLDLTSNPYAVSLYKLELSEGHYWRLGLEADAGRIGSSLSPQLTLFDAQGHPLSSSSSGRDDAPTDPYLFHGLAPGAYYVGVSGVGNVGGSAGGGYDLANGDPGTLGHPQSGGMFTLNAVADAADTPVSLIDFNTVHFDPLDTTPIGVEMQFSGPLDLGSQTSTIIGRANSGVKVVDAEGRSWPVQLSAYDEANARITYLFQDALPVGDYKVVIPKTGGLTDLAGLTPFTPGLPGRVLATFAVAPRIQINDPMALGTPSPNALTTGLDEHVEIAAGQTVSYRFVSAADTFYNVTTSPEGGSVQVQIVEVATGRTIALESGPANESTTKFAGMHTGVYLIQFKAGGSDRVRLDWNLTMPPIPGDSILANGVGQGAAMNLHLIAPGAADSSSAATPSPVTPANRGGPASAPLPQSFTAANPGTTLPNPSTQLGAAAGRTEEGSALLSATTSGPSGLFLGVSGALVGRPLEASESVAAVGPGSGSALASLLSGAPGQGATNLGRSDVALVGRLGFGEDVSDPTLAANDEPNHPDISGALPAAVLQASVEPPTSPELGWLEKLRAALGAGLPASQGGATVVEPSPVEKGTLADASADPAGLYAGGRGDGAESHDTAYAGVSTPLAAGLVAVLVARSHQSLHSWFGKGKRISIPVGEGSPASNRV
jgi:methionine-rich copper-binding protein CopC